VSPPIKDNRQSYLQLIESEKILDNRFTNIKRLDPQGGNGTFSLMFYAYDELKKNNVVLKFYNPDFYSNTDRQQRFQREGDILNKLDGQPNILQSYSGIRTITINLSHQTGNIPFAFQFIPIERASGSIEQFIYATDKNPIHCFLYFKEMCKAVARIHSKNICHRDLKPSNFLLFKDSIVKLGDFGAAKYLDGSMSDIQSHYQLPVGDIRYCSPEIFCSLGIGDQLAYCGDIFALGAILFEIFTQKVLAENIYSGKQNFWNDIMKLKSKVLSIPEKERAACYLSEINSIISQRDFPDIFAFNDFIPKSIKNELNILYRSLIDPNINKRLTDFTTMQRRTDICLLVLRNEKHYQEYIKRKRLIKTPAFSSTKGRSK
jgi:Serine/threonine protein kinase